MKGFQSHGKDIDREILLSMDNEDLLKTCSLNKYFLNEVCDDMFFKNRLMRTYPNTLKYKELNEYKRLSWKQYFLQVIFYIAKLDEDYLYDYTDGNFKTQLQIFKESKGNADALLINSAESGELVLVKEALKREANIHADDDYALRWASGYGHIEVVKYLAEHGANIHAGDDLALRYAIEKGHIEVVKYFIEHETNKANIHEHDDYALRWASENGHMEVVKYLVEHGANIHANNDEALRWASTFGHIEVVNYLKSLP